MKTTIKMLALGITAALLTAAAMEPPTISDKAADDKATKKVAKVGEAAPDFVLKDLDGKEYKLSDFKGKTVVLEWFNGQCPYVVRLHERGALKGYGSELNKKDEYVWLAINSNAPGTQGAGVELNKKLVEKFEIQYPVLVDEDGKVGRMYDARTTPHMYVISPAGKLVYAGAIDNDPQGRRADSDDYVNYVKQALDQLRKGESVSPDTTRPYGCSVKYKN